ncbi:helix-turn-helix transcriptional regulator [Nocardioides daejeonensis]|uniref:helix-turn-helix transcriptional regulator n=1 Tax=Nocardioides daejeonensis TaxID=1046556 RepID=UPI000D740DFD|nr:helix-turn-helix transcriptional regulator [Nocardioides daejeonensis]
MTVDLPVAGRPDGATELAPFVELAELEQRALAGREALATSDALGRPMRLARKISEALTRLEQFGTAAELLRAVPGEFGAAGDFDRVLFSTVDGSRWTPQAWWARDPRRPQDRAVVASLQGSQLDLVGGMVEAEVVRRRTTALVRDTEGGLRTWAPFTEIAESVSYIAAPVVVEERVAGLLHVDAGLSGREIGEVEMAHTKQFAEGLGLLLERLATRARVDTQARRIQEALDAAAAALAATPSASVSLRSTTPDSPEELVGVARVPAPRSGGLAEKLTQREREVFDLLVGGATNAQIADRLTVSETTVKSHVKHILRKLNAANRAQVIARYLRDGRQGDWS